MTFFGSGRGAWTFDFNQTFARHRPINGATMIEPKATAKATCIVVLSSWPVGIECPRALPAQVEMISGRSPLALLDYRLSCGETESPDAFNTVTRKWDSGEREDVEAPALAIGCVR